MTPSHPGVPTWSAAPPTACNSLTPEYHMWTECSGFVGGGSQSMTWNGLPGYVSGADLSNSQIFYDWIDTTMGGIKCQETLLKLI